MAFGLSLVGELRAIYTMTYKTENDLCENARALILAWSVAVGNRKKMGT
ncbi:hypothetical protein C5167_031636 [Papaver somniferum]|uniref:Uncharacterized protein n=1 Tax=Papaver somniferum TaxID=3469 RepID=A0A4Y7K8P7_PAPSO|nr:hypothetical protein C5167_031636 [Papaver somniferum]